MYPNKAEQCTSDVLHQDDTLCIGSWRSFQSTVVFDSIGNAFLGIYRHRWVISLESERIELDLNQILKIYTAVWKLSIRKPPQTTLGHWRSILAFPNVFKILKFRLLLAYRILYHWFDRIQRPIDEADLLSSGTENRDRRRCQWTMEHVREYTSSAYIFCLFRLLTSFGYISYLNRLLRQSLSGLQSLRTVNFA